MDEERHKREEKQKKEREEKERQQREEKERQQREEKERKLEKRRERERMEEAVRQRKTAMEAERAKRKEKEREEREQEREREKGREKERGKERELGTERKREKEREGKIRSLHSSSNSSPSQSKKALHTSTESNSQTWPTNQEITLASHSVVERENDREESDNETEAMEESGGVDSDGDVAMAESPDSLSDVESAEESDNESEDEEAYDPDDESSVKRKREQKKKRDNKQNSAKRDNSSVAKKRRSSLVVERAKKKRKQQEEEESDSNNDGGGDYSYPSDDECSDSDGSLSLRDSADSVGGRSDVPEMWVSPLDRAIVEQYRKELSGLEKLDLEDRYIAHTIFEQNCSPLPPPLSVYACVSLSRFLMQAPSLFLPFSCSLSLKCVRSLNHPSHSPTPCGALSHTSVSHPSLSSLRLSPSLSFFSHSLASITKALPPVHGC